MELKTCGNANSGPGSSDSDNNEAADIVQAETAHNDGTEKLNRVEVVSASKSAETSTTGHHPLLLRLRLPKHRLQQRQIMRRRETQNLVPGVAIVSRIKKRAIFSKRESRSMTVQRSKGRIWVAGTRNEGLARVGVGK